MNDIEIGSKRSADEFATTNYEEQQNNTGSYNTKKNRNDEIMMRLLLAGKDCGPIVGQGGENLRRLRREFTVDVQMPAGRATTRVFMITGSLESCLCVVNDILKHANKGAFPVGRENVVEINLLVQSDLVAPILGKSGSRIKEIREQSDTKIKVYPDCLPNSNERVIAIGADQADKIEKCVQMIFSVLQNVKRVSQPYYYDPAMNANMGSNIDYSGHEFGRNSTAGGGIKNGNLVTDNSGNEFFQAKTETNITVSNNMCGAIIGKGGNNIRDIRNQSGAQITFSGELDERVITVAGTQRQVHFAEELLAHSCMHINMK